MREIKRKSTGGRREQSPFDYVTSDLGIIKIGMTVILAVIAVFVLKTLGPILKPLLIAIFLYVLICPIEQFLMRIKVPRFVAYVLIFIALFIVGFFLGKLISYNVKSFMEKLPIYAHSIQRMIAGFTVWIGGTNFLGEIGVDWIPADLPISASTINRVLREYAARGIGSVFGLVGTLFLIFFLMVFIILEVEQFSPRVIYAYGKRRSNRILRVIKAVNRDVRKYLVIKTALATVDGIIFALLLWACGVEFSILWGVSAFMLFFIPYVGVHVAILLPVLMVLVQFSGAAALLMLVVLGIIQILMGNYVSPRIMGKGLNLSPLVILFSLTFWGWLWGVVGVFMAIPITATIKIIMEDTHSTRKTARLLGTECEQAPIPSVEERWKAVIDKRKGKRGVSSRQGAPEKKR
ncbi:MAG: AI-2E family transporter [Deltaproteobacteria bacterium]|nr:AI-2E family transporter [Candidatus Zymogenaceae bacterium]